MTEDPGRPDGQSEPPPFGGSWTRLYVAVLVELAGLVILFWLLTRSFS
jgi:hypothetical protein